MRDVALVSVNDFRKHHRAQVEDLDFTVEIADTELVFEQNQFECLVREVVSLQIFGGMDGFDCFEVVARTVESFVL